MDSRTTDRETLVRRTTQAGTQEMRPETFARFERHCVFNKLGFEDLQRIGELHLRKWRSLTPRATGSRSVQAWSSMSSARVTASSLAPGRWRARPSRFCSVVSREMLKNGGLPVCGVVEYDRRANRCFLNGRT